MTATNTASPFFFVTNVTFSQNGLLIIKLFIYLV